MLTSADTAFTIAAIRANEAKLPPEERLFEDPYARLFDAAGEHAREGTERMLALPFVSDGVRLRTRFTDDLLRDALKRGCRQVAIVGAGFDARALRLPEIAAAGAKVFEIDFPAQLETKTRILLSGGVALPAWNTYVGCDFTAADFEDPLSRDLQARGFLSGASTVFVWEGVIAYIDNAAVDRTLRVMVAVGGPGSRVVFDFAHERFDPERIDARTRRLGFSRFDEYPMADVWKKYLAGEPHSAARILRMGVATV